MWIFAEPVIHTYNIAFLTSCTWFHKMLLSVMSVATYVCVECVSAFKLLITSAVMWPDIHRPHMILNKFYSFSMEPEVSIISRCGLNRPASTH